MIKIKDAGSHAGCLHARIYTASSERVVSWSGLGAADLMMHIHGVENSKSTQPYLPTLFRFCVEDETARCRIDMSRSRMLAAAGK